MATDGPTKQQFNQFVAHLRYWVDKFNLRNWSTTIEAGTDDECGAWIRPHHIYRTMAVQVNEERKFVTYPETARHEAIEMLLSDICRHLEDRYSVNYIQELRHEVVHRLENILPLPTDKEVGYMPCGKKKKPKGK